MTAPGPPSIVNAYVESKTSKLVLLRRDGDSLSVVRQPAEYVSYHRVSDLTPEKLRLLRRDDGLRGDRMEGEWYRVQWQDYLSRRMALQDDGVLARLGLPHYEADVHPIRRYLVDSGARVQKPRRAFLDIETDSRLSFARLRAGQGRVLCWTVVDEVGKAKSGCLTSDFDGAERELLCDLLDVLDGFDQVVAWNGDGFDFPVLKGDTRTKSPGRFRHLGIRVDTRRWLWIDHLALYKRMNLQTARSGDEKQSHRLQDIAVAVLGEGKENFDSSKTWEAWLCTDASVRQSRDALVRYNVKDTDLLRRIEEKTGFLALLDTICDCCGTLPDTRGMRPLNQLDPFMLRLGLARGMHFPTVTRFESDDDKKKFAGAYVMEPKFPPGILRDVHVCDFKSLYPSIIISWNMSPETKIEGSRGSTGPIPVNCSRAPGTDVMFRTDIQGLLPLAVDRLLTMRSEWKKKKGSCVPGTPEWMDADRRSNAYKVTSNAFFGGTGNEFSRFNDVDVAESITQAGVYLDHAVEDALVSGGWFCGYGDTDSTMVSGDKDRRVFSAAVQTVLNEQVIPRVMEEHGCVDRRVSIAYEKQFNRIVFMGKKRYCNPPEAPILMMDFSFKPLGDIRVGDLVMGWTFGDEKQKRRLISSKVVAVQKHIAPIVKLTMRSGRTIRCTPDHRWLRARQLHIKGPTGRKYFYPWCTPKIGRKLQPVVFPPRQLMLDQQLSAAWLAGIFDGEGSVSGLYRDQIVISQSRKVNPDVCDRIERSLRELGFDFHIGVETAHECLRYQLRGGKQARANFLNWCRPAKSRQIIEGMRKSFFKIRGDEIVSIEEDGEGEVIGLTTETGNYVAWGYASKNCGSYIHYDGSDALLDSEPEIKGLEFKRGDTNKIARRLQERVIRMLLGDWEPTCASCGGKCKSGDDAPKGRMTAQLWSCLVCGLRDDGGLLFAKNTEDPGDFSALIAKARDYVLLAKKLPLEFVTVSKSIQKPIEDYVVKTKLDGAPAAQPPHVTVAKMLAERGEEVSVGTKIAYVVVDGSDDKPTRAIPASDYVGDCDRFYLWDNLVWPPIERVLDAALPGTPWRRMFGRTRPAKEKPPKRGGAAPGQLGFFGNHVPAGSEQASALPPLPPRVEGAPSVPAMLRSTRPYVIRVDAAKATHELLLAVREACSRYPGTRPVQVEIEGVGPHEFTVEMSSRDLRVEGKSALLAELSAILDRPAVC